jgi:DNA-binding MarR family transcriptional regulator
MSEGNLLQRFHALGVGVLSELLTKSDIKVLFVLAEHAGPSLIAYPSIATIAELCDMKESHVSRSLQRLREAGLIQVAEQGTRTGRSTQHRLTLHGVAELVAHRDEVRARRKAARQTHDGDPTAEESGEQEVPPQQAGHVPPNEEGQVPPGLVAAPPNAGSEVPPTPGDKPPTNRDRKGSGEGVGGSFGTGPGGPALAAPTKDMVDRFWSIYPKGEKKAAAERELRARVEAGTSFDEIVAGAERYARFCKAVHREDRYIAFAVNWLREERWRDDFKLPEPRSRKNSAVEIPTFVNRSHAKGAAKSRAKAGSTNRRQPIERAVKTPEERAAERQRRAQRKAELEQANRERAAKEEVDRERLVRDGKSNLETLLQIFEPVTTSHNALIGHARPVMRYWLKNNPKYERPSMQRAMCDGFATGLGEALANRWDTDMARNWLGSAQRAGILQAAREYVADVLASGSMQ